MTTPKRVSAVLLSHGLLMSAGFASLFFIAPLQARVPAFLAIYAALCIISANLVRSLKNQDARGDLVHSEAETRTLILVIFGFGVLFRLALLFSGPPFSTDVYRYIWDGRVQLAGINPYTYPPAAPELAFLRDAQHGLINHPDLNTIYPPLAELVFRLGAAISPTMLGFKMIFGLFDLAAAWMLVLLLRSKGLSPAWAAVYAWHPLVVFEFAGSGHVDSLMLLLLLAAFYLCERKQAALGALGFACAALSKFVPLVMIPWLLVQRDKKAGAAYFSLLIAGCLSFAAGLGRASLTGFRAFGQDWMANPSLFAALGLLIHDPGARKLILGTGLVAGSFLWARKTTAKPDLFALGSLFALLLCSSVVQPWYVLWILPLLCLYPLWSGFAWTWLVGLLYVVFDKRSSGLIYSLWAWVWTVEYFIVYLLLGKELISKLLGKTSARDGKAFLPAA